MPAVPRIFGHSLYIAAIFILLLFYGSEYEWMETMDGAIGPSVIEGSGNRTVFAGLALVLALLSEGAVAAITQSRGERHIALACAAFAVFLFLAGQRSAFF